MKKYYGFRYWSGRSTTWNNTNRIAGQLEIFETLDALNDWLNNEKLSSPCGCGGGERVRVTRERAIEMMGKKEFESEVDSFLHEQRWAKEDLIDWDDFFKECAQ